ncbi:MAG: tetratricopeptide repeat protein [Candidatus Auribacterota bacterium]
MATGPLWNEASDRSLPVYLAYKKGNYEQAAMLASEVLESGSDRYLLTIRAYSYLQLQEYDSALADCNQLIEYCDNDSLYYYLRGITYWKKNDMENAIKDLDSALAILNQTEESLSAQNETSSLAVTIHQSLGSIYVDLDDYGHAIPHLDEAIAHSNKPEGNDFYSRAYCYYMTGDKNSSLRDITNAINQDNSDPGFYAFRAKIYTELNQLNDALADYDRCIALNPNSWEYFNQRAQIYVSQAQYTEATADFSSVLKMNPELKEIRVARAYCYFKLDDYDKALTDFLQANMLNSKHKIISPFETTARLHRAVQFINEKQFDDAVEDLSCLIESFPEQGEYRFYRGLAWYYKKEYQKALDDIHSAEQIDPNNSKIYVAAGDILSSMGKISQANEEFRRAIELNNDEIQAYIGMGINLMFTLGEDSALIPLKEALKRDPENGETLCLLMYIYLQKNDFQNALACVEPLIARNEDSSGYLYFFYGFILENLHRKGEAVTAYEHVIKRASGGSDVLEIESRKRINFLCGNRFE